MTCRQADSTPLQAGNNQAQNLILGSTGPTASAHASTLLPQATYDGGYPNAKSVRLRVANGGAGQSGLIKAFADAFIKAQVAKSVEPFKVRRYRLQVCSCKKVLIVDFLFCRWNGIWVILLKACSTWLPSMSTLLSRTIRQRRRHQSTAELPCRESLSSLSV